MVHRRLKQNPKYFFGKEQNSKLIGTGEMFHTEIS